MITDNAETSTVDERIRLEGVRRRVRELHSHAGLCGIALVALCGGLVFLPKWSASSPELRFAVFAAMSGYLMLMALWCVVDEVVVVLVEIRDELRKRPS